MINNFDDLIAQALKRDKITVAVAAAGDEAALIALLEAWKLGLTEAILFGDPEQIAQLWREAAGEEKLPFAVHAAVDDLDAARAAVAAIRRGEAQMLLKGKIKTSELLKVVLDSASGLRSSRLLSDVFVFEDTGREGNQLMMITDGGVTLRPDLRQKIELIENAVAVAHALGNRNPKVALLSAVETVTPSLPATIDAAVLTKMNQRGQIKGCIIDGPLALDNAVSAQAAAVKGIDSPVAGRADILVCPDIEAANMLAKSTTYFARLRLGHVIMGSTVPVLIPSRADSADNKLLSIAMGKLVCQSGKA